MEETTVLEREDATVLKALGVVPVSENATVSEDVTASENATVSEDVTASEDVVALEKANKLINSNNSTPLTDDYLKIGNRKVWIDYYVAKDIPNDPNKKYCYSVFTRLNAKEKHFKRIRFDHCIFDGCYMNECVFDSCTFIGCKFIGCNFHLCAFTGCNFDYATFERTHIDDDILATEAPSRVNLRMRFARSLRMNYQQIGDSKAVNKAISLELKATSVYLWESWTSPEEYYCKKYPGFKRVSQFFRWYEFWLLDFIWGNGESVLKLLRTIFLMILFLGLIDTIQFHDANSVRDYLQSIANSSAVFFGFDTPVGYKKPYVALIAAMRLILFALITAILVKRFNRR